MINAKQALSNIRLLNGRTLSSIATFKNNDIIIDFGNYNGRDIDYIEQRIRQCLLELCNIQNPNLLIAGDYIVQHRTIALNLNGLFTPLQNVKKILLIGSGKGGVGKSTISANLALAMQSSGLKVGIMDADLHGSSIPNIFNITNKSSGAHEPIISREIAIMSLSIVSQRSSEDAIIWRGPMLSKVLLDIIRKTQWPEIDYLIIDTPPGTGDIHLSLIQHLPIDAAILVSTPCALSTTITGHTAIMLEKFGIQIHGLVRNMAYMDEPQRIRLDDADLTNINIKTICDIPMDERIRNCSWNQNNPICTELFDVILRIL